MRALFAACAALALSAQDAPARLAAEIQARAALRANLEGLCDDLGPRLTGSPGLERAQAWALATLRRQGAEHVHLETYDLGRPWHRGEARARLLNASGIRLSIAQWGWTEGTKGVVRGDVVLLDTPTLAAFEAVAPRLKGKVVLVKARPRATPEERRDLDGYRARLRKAWGAVPFALLLIPSDKAAGLPDMAGGPDFPYRARTAFISAEHAALLQRLLAKGVVPKVEAELGGGFGPRPVKAANVVAELPGSEHPEEVVILGAHLDAWDLGSGATDNGAGVVAFLEVMRAVKAAGLKPKRTLRLVLFSGEEQGLLGSKAYLAAHRSEAERIQAVLVMDAGSGRIIAMADGQVDAWAEALQAVLGDLPVEYARPGGSDQETFRNAGIPAFSPQQEPLDYGSHTQHTPLDTVDHVVEADLLQATQVMARAAWGLLNGPRLPHVTPDPAR
ncbi:MAG TPA: M20/M25/M40 family metallo-hydrolase [Holophagaceae bacterium]|nr:M20/M25/M40 family metallo-hydrolase [Holophagaceae bacterium]